MTIARSTDATELPSAGGMKTESIALFLLLVLLAGLPVSVWLDTQNLTATALSRQARDMNSMVSAIRGYYSAKVVDRVLSAHGGPVVPAHNYESIPGAIPIPATLSLELGAVIGEKQSNVAYRFVSDYPFKNRAPHQLDGFEQRALQTLRANPAAEPPMLDTSSGFTSQVRLITPVLMGASCVNCHNAHPESPKRDWKVGDVRGIQEVTITQPTALSIGSFRWSLAYFIFVAVAGLYALVWQHRQNMRIRGMNAELQGTNRFLARLSSKISPYLSPQIYKSIFSGEMDVTLQTKRKKLTIFFSDIKGFTDLTEQLQPEALASLINEYLTEMSTIALKHGGTIDKYIGDAILVFFGDPESRGPAEDARACLRMAVEMQDRLAQLNVKWRRDGAEKPFRVRMGINTGFCNVGNFGSADRMDYTILGAEANLAARLQSAAEPGTIIVSYETYSLVSDIVSAHALPAISLKGISREVVPYVIERLFAHSDERTDVFSAQEEGLDLYMDIDRSDPGSAERLRGILARALKALDHVNKPG